MDRIDFLEDEMKPPITDFSHLSPFFRLNQIHRIRQSVIDPPVLPENSNTMVDIDREHETKKRKHNAVLGRNFFIQTSNQINRSIVKATTGRIPRKKVATLYSGPVPDKADIVNWEQVHRPCDIIDNENENVIVLSRILETENKPLPIGFRRLSQGF